MYPAVPRSIPRARQALREFARRRAGFAADDVDAVGLAVTEAVTNSVKHAYLGRPGAVEVLASVVRHELWILISDQGCGYRTAASDPGLGLGLAVIAGLCDDLVITERPHGGTDLEMAFRPAARRGARTADPSARRSCPPRLTSGRSRTPAAARPLPRPRSARGRGGR